MKVVFLLSTFVSCIFYTSCKSFREIAHPGIDYTTGYNLPGEPIVPYTNPENIGERERVSTDQCDLVRTEEGIRCL